MLQLKRNRSAFTLIELLVVVIIVAVLASVGVPLLSANVERAQMTEAETGLGTIRTAVRAFIVENNALPATVAAAGLTANDMLGQFFDLTDYAIVAGGTTTDYCLSATGGLGADPAPGSAKVNGKTRSMDEFGSITTSADCT